MLTVSLKTPGVYSSHSPNGVRKGNKGRIELSVERDQDGDLILSFMDFGNFGRLRGEALVPLTEDMLTDMINALTQFRDGELDNTHIPFLVEGDSSPVNLPSADAEELEEDEELDPALASDALDETDDMDSITA